MENKLTIEVKRIRFIALFMSVLTIIFVGTEVYAQKLGTLPKKTQAEKENSVEPKKAEVGNGTKGNNTGKKTGKNTGNNKGGKKTHNVNTKQTFVFEVEPETLPEFGSNGGTATIKVKSKGGQWKISSNPSDSWCRIAKDGNEIRVTVLKNTSTSPRKDSFTIKQGSKSKTINIQQDAAQGYMYPHTNNIIISAEGGVKEVSIASNLDWLTSGKLDFGTILKEKDKIVIVVAKNDGPERTGYFYVKANNLESRIKVTQEGSKVKSPMPPIEKNISTNRLEYDASGGTQYVILSDNQWYLSYSNQPSWIKTEKDNGVLVVTVEPNKSKFLRSHSLIVTINGKKELIDIIQESKQTKNDKTSSGKQNKRFSVGPRQPHQNLRLPISSFK